MMSTRFTTLAAFLIALSSSIPVAVNGADFEIYPDTRIPRGSIVPGLGIPLKEGLSLDCAWRACQKICDAMTDCVAFTAIAQGDAPNYNGTGEPNPWPVCVAKDSRAKTNRLRSDPGRVSGIKKASGVFIDPTSPVCVYNDNFNIIDNVRIKGGSIVPLTGIPLAVDLPFHDATVACREICAAMTNCVAFTLIGQGDAPDFGGVPGAFNPYPACVAKDDTTTFTQFADQNRQSGIKL